MKRKRGKKKFVWVVIVNDFDFNILPILNKWHVHVFQKASQAYGFVYKERSKKLKKHRWHVDCKKMEVL